MNIFLKTIYSLLCIISTVVAQDSIPVQIDIQQKDKATILVFYKDGDASKTVSGNEIAPNSYLVHLPNNGYIPFKIMVNTPKNMHMSSTGFTPKPMPSLLAGPDAKLQIKVLDGDQLNLEIVCDDPNVRLFEQFAKEERSYQAKSFANIQNDSKADPDEKEAMLRIKQNFVKNNPDSYSALAVFSSYYMMLPAQQARKQLVDIAKDYKTSPLYLEIKEKLDATLKSALGSKIPYFEAIDLDGQLFKSNQLGGKYYLIDFWGSWCQPCRASHPELRKTYQKYNSQGLEILGVALETGSQEEQVRKWEQAIEEDQINWRHVLNTKQHNIVELFGVTSYPTKILVDPEGNIVYRSGQGQDDLNQILNGIFEDKESQRANLLNYLNKLLNANTAESKQTLYLEAKKLEQAKNESDLILAKKIYKELGEDAIVNQLTAKSIKEYPKGITAREQAANLFLAKIENEDAHKTERAYQQWLKKFPVDSFEPQDRGFYDMVLLQLLKHFSSKEEFNLTDKYKDNFIEQSLKTVSYYNIAESLLKAGHKQQSRNYLEAALNWSEQAKNAEDPKTRSSFGALMYNNIALLNAEVSLELDDPKVAINNLPRILNDGKYQVMQVDKMALILANAYQKSERYLDAFLTLDAQARINNASPEVWDSLENLYVKLNQGKGIFADYKKEIETVKNEQDLALLKSKMVKKDFPDFELQNREGETVRLSDFKGKTVILDFWATWCIPCVNSFPIMQKMINKYADKDVVFLFINTWEKQANFKQAVDKLITQNSYTFEVLYDELSDKNDALLATQIGVPSLPTKVVLDKEGHMRFMISGSDPQEEAMTQEIENLIRLSNQD
ncbi:TlpA disulfide reductase family protein [Sphingobacterium faecale]|uniref:TlpA family protein disulfide reductase n=1 Tax=Sphingobacterium faecale TaxID=2803775 RepID=A0ABS1R519_9SPHI|nr:TlpA disulfide reductase family protein [Sphingobacterium faecale]MBL1409808.1 TlpA family protein disulfide reductase [Sphingobacterium faecale]